MKRSAAQTIFQTVVFAGAMLGTSACGKKPAPAAPAPSNNAVTTDPATPADKPADPCANKPADPCASNPCRPRPPANPCGGGVGRGFILS